MCNSLIDGLTIFEDNQSASQIINSQFHGHAKHIGMKFHFIREFVSDGTVKLHCKKSLVKELK